MKRLAFVLSFALLAVAACGGGNKSSSTTPAGGGETMARATAPDCKAAADRVANGKEMLAKALESRCQADGWSDEARACLAETGEAGPCVLTDQQRSGIEQERAREHEAQLREQQALEEAQKSSTEEAAKKSAEPPPPPKDAPRTRAPVKKPKGDGKTADPCEGGE